MLQSQFNALDQHRHHNEISMEQFCRNTSLFGTFSKSLSNKSNTLSTLLFQVFDRNRSSRIELSDFKYTLGILTHGSIMERSNRMLYFFNINVF